MALTPRQSISAAEQGRSRDASVFCRGGACPPNCANVALRPNLIGWGERLPCRRVETRKSRLPWRCSCSFLAASRQVPSSSVCIAARPWFVTPTTSRWPWGIWKRSLTTMGRNRVAYINSGSGESLAGFHGCGKGSGRRCRENSAIDQRQSGAAEVMRPAGRERERAHRGLAGIGRFEDAKSIRCREAVRIDGGGGQDDLRYRGNYAANARQ